MFIIAGIAKKSHRAAYEKFKDGTVKKISDELPFEIPDGWAWARIDEATSVVTDFVASGSFATLRENVKYFNKPNYAVLLRTKDLNSGLKGELVYTDKAGYDFLINSRLHGGELILPNIGASIGKVFIVPKTNFRMTLAPNAIMVRCFEAPTLQWLHYFFQSYAGQDALQEISSATAQGKFNKTDFRHLVVCMPPLAQQKRIVAKIEELFALANSLGEAADGLVNTAKRIDKKILDLAIHGKLVPQDPKDEPASELVKRIAASHKSPCKNYNEPIDPPFEIPDSWEWVRLGKVSNIVRGTGIKRNETTSAGVQCIMYGEIYTHYGESFAQTFSFVPKAVADKCHDAKCGDVLCTLTGENEVEIAKATAYTGKERLVIGGDLARISNHPYDPMLLVYFMFSPFMISQKASVCTGGMIVHMGKSALSNLYIPLPPLAEQKRIVAKIEELRAVIKSLTT